MDEFGSEVMTRERLVARERLGFIKELIRTPLFSHPSCRTLLLKKMVETLIQELEECRIEYLRSAASSTTNKSITLSAEILSDLHDSLDKVQSFSVDVLKQFRKKKPRRMPCNG